MDKAAQQAVDVIQQVLIDVQPLVLSHGGRIEFERYENNTVYVKLYGACVGCAFSSFTIQMGILEAIKKRLPEVTQVIAIE